MPRQDFELFLHDSILLWMFLYGFDVVSIWLFIPLRLLARICARPLASRARGPNGPQTFRERISRTFTRQRRDGANFGGPNGPRQQTRAAPPRSRMFSQKGDGEVTTYINYVVTINPHVDILQARAPNQEI